MPELKLLYFFLSCTPRRLSFFILRSLGFVHFHSRPRAAVRSFVSAGVSALYWCSYRGRSPTTKPESHSLKFAALSGQWTGGLCEITSCFIPPISPISCALAWQVPRNLLQSTENPVWRCGHSLAECCLKAQHGVLWLINLPPFSNLGTLS